MNYEEIFRPKFVNPAWKTRERYHELTRLVREREYDASVWVEYAQARLFRTETAEALKAYRKALLLAPDDKGLRLTFANLLINASPYNRNLNEELPVHEMVEEAEAMFLELSRLPSHSFAARIGLARCDFRLGRIDRAMGRLVTLAEEFPENAAMLWAEAMHVPSSYPGKKELMDKSLAVCDIAQAVRALLTMPAIQVREDDFSNEIRRLTAVIDHLERLDLKFPFSTSMLRAYNFYPMLWFNENHLHLKTRVNNFFQRSCPELNYSSPGVRKRLEMPRPRRIRLGFVLNRCWDLDFASMWYNLFSRIDKSRFEIVLLYNDRILNENEYAKKLRSLLDEEVIFPAVTWPEYRKILANAEVDILLFENWGACPTFTGCVRLAPVQVLFHDMTTSHGAPEEDYVLLHAGSATSAEIVPLYRGKVAFMDGTYLAVDPNRADPEPVSKTEFGIPDHAKLILHSQLMLRWRPQDDWILASLLRDNPDAWMLFRHEYSSATYLIEERWRRGALSEFMDRVRFFHFQPLPRLLGLMKQADLFLSAPMDSGLVTFETALGVDIPVAFCRESSPPCRALSDIYKKMGFMDLVSDTSEEHAHIMNRLLSDRDWRDEMSAKINANKHRLYDIGTTIETMQDFLEAAYARAKQGLSPAHWASGRFME